MPKINTHRYNLRPFNSYDPQFDDPPDGIMDRGPWHIDVWSPRDGSTSIRIVLQSDDFNHDAALEISGDFATQEQKMKYAEFIRDQLNCARSGRR